MTATIAFTGIVDVPIARAQQPPAAAPISHAHEPITVAADWCTHWQEGDYDVWHLRGNCYVNQGLTYARAPEAILWVDARDFPRKPIRIAAYFEGAEGDVSVDYGNVGSDATKNGVLGRQRTNAWFQRFESSAPLQWKLPPAVAPSPERPPLHARGLAQLQPDRRPQILLAQYNEFAPSTGGLGNALPPNVRRFSITQRSDSPYTIDYITLPTGEKAGVATGGVRVLVEGLPATDLPAAIGPLGVLDISADRVVVWASGVDPLGENSGAQTHDQPLELYMEGNIEFRQGDRIIYADRMFYDVRRKVGVILNAEMLTPLPTIDGYNYPGLVRLKAESIRQLDDMHFAATNALVTTSRLEKPAYDFSANQITFTDVQAPRFDPLTGAALATANNELDVQHQQLAEARGNVLHIRGIPVFYWPVIATDLTKPSFIIDRVKVGSDSVFGTQVMVDLDAYQLFGVRNAPAGTEWHLSTDYFSDRGPAGGTDFEWDRPEVFGFIGPARGYLDFWAINDDGLDNLGLGRRDIAPEETFRYRFMGKHRQRLENGWDVAGELGWLSDRTFQEQYFEADWDQQPDPRSGVRIKKIENNRALSLEANGQLNDFYTETQWLPRLDHYWLGEPLWGDRLTWYEHTSLGFADQDIATTPSNATLASQFELLPWEEFGGVPISASGERLATRHEIDLPLQAGPVKVVPFALGEVARWGEALDGSSLNRGYVHTGVRASIPMWAAFPNVRDPLFNLNGLAHKVVFDAEFAYADASANFDELPLYDQLDDISITEFRRRLFSGALPPTITDAKFDPRRFALRSGMQGWVSGPSTEIADDLMTLRMGVRQRWQTKRGPAGHQHIVDWITLDMNATYFPDADRDNFGQEFGLLDYDLRWHLGDRFTVLSDGFADLFGSGLKTVAAGVLLNRPTLGNAYLGLRSIDGPVTSNVLLGSFAYRLSEKWILTSGAAFDFENTGNIGQTFSATRIGESFTLTAAMNVDASKDNVGLSILFEPRFLPDSRLQKTTGIFVPPAGALTLE